MMSDDIVKRLKKWGAFGYGVEASATMIEAADEIERLRALAAPPAAPGEQAKSRVDREGGFNAARMYYGDEFAREPSPFVPPPAAPAGGEIDLLIIELRDDAERSFKDADPETVIRVYENERHAAAAALAALQERVSEQNEIIALAATDYLRTKDKWTSEPLLRENFPRMIADLAETGEWMRGYVRDRNGAMAELAGRMKAAETRVKALEKAIREALVDAEECPAGAETDPFIVAIQDQLRAALSKAGASDEG